MQKQFASKIFLDLYLKENRDKSTRRSVEIPYAGGLFVPKELKNIFVCLKKDKSFFLVNSRGMFKNLS